MNYEGAREWINSQIDRLLNDLKELEDNAEFGDPGIYYENVAEAQRLNRRIEDLVHELEEMELAL